MQRKNETPPLPANQHNRNVRKLNKKRANCVPFQAKKGNRRTKVLLSKQMNFFPSRVKKHTKLTENKLFRTILTQKNPPSSNVKQKIITQGKWGKFLPNCKKQKKQKILQRLSQLGAKQ